LTARTAALYNSVVKHNAFRTVVYAFLGMSIAALSACGSSSAAPSASAPAASPASASAGASGAGNAQAKWDALVAAAKKEGKITLAVAPGGGASAREVIPPAFKQAFGIDVEVLVGPSSQLVERLKLEQSSGIHSVDVAIGGADTMYSSFYGDKLIAPVKDQLIRPEVMNPASWTIGHPWFMDPEEQSILRISSGLSGFTAINTNLVKAADLTSSSDFLKPEYKGKIAVFDPTINGSGGQHASYMLIKLGPDFVKKLYVDQQPVKTQDNRQFSDWVGRGNYPIGWGMNPANIEGLKADKLPVRELPTLKDVQPYLTGGSGLMVELKEPPHPNAAAVFLNWMAMPEGNAVYNKAIQMVSPLTTVKSDWVPDYVQPKAGVDYLDTYGWDYSLKTYPEAFKQLRQLLGASA